MKYHPIRIEIWWGTGFARWERKEAQMGLRATAITLIMILGASGCSQTEEDPTDVDVDGKADLWDEGCSPPETFPGADGQCVEWYEICQQTDGMAVDWGCICRDGKYFRPVLGGCVAEEEARNACTSTQGSWEEDTTMEPDMPGEQFYCKCPTGRFLVADQGGCYEWWDVCHATGGTAHDWGCHCGTDRYFRPVIGGCTSAENAEVMCTSTEGTWAEDSTWAPDVQGEHYFCTCSGERILFADSGGCYDWYDICDQTGGMAFDWGCHCSDGGIFLAAVGGCIDAGDAADACEMSGGSWEEDPAWAEDAPGPTHLCNCGESLTLDIDTGTCG